MEWIERIIRIDSVTHHTNEEVVRFLVPLLEETGLTIREQRIKEHGETFINLRQLYLEHCDNRCPGYIPGSVELKIHCKKKSKFRTRNLIIILSKIVIIVKE